MARYRCSLNRLPRTQKKLPASAGYRGSDLVHWHKGEAEGGAKPVRLCPCSSDVNLFSYGEGIVDLNAEISDGALDLRMSQRVGFVLRISFLIENQGPVAHRSVLAVATGCAGR